MAMRIHLVDIVENRGHKNYCYQRFLAEKSPFDSFRFDFRGNGESGRSIHAPRSIKVFSLEILRQGRHGRFRSCLELSTRKIWLSYMGFSGTFSRYILVPSLILGANAAFHYVVLRDGSIPLIVNASGRFMSELLKARIEKFYPDGLQSGSFIEKWTFPGGEIRERRTPAEEILGISSLDNKIGLNLGFLVDFSGSVAEFMFGLDVIWDSRSRISLVDEINEDCSYY
jgi:hypothetical protein